jgi:DNA-binding transcriptional MerR regulator/quercetin dioxygenase-like cupin family protein
VVARRSTVGIGGAAATIGVSAGTLRLWEAEGLVSPKRGVSGAREYSDRDLLQLRRVHHLRTVNRLNAPGIRQVLGLSGRSGDEIDVDERSRPDFRALRRSAGLTIKETARRAGLSLSFLSALERGLAGASPGTVSRVLAAFGDSGPWFDTVHDVTPLRPGDGKVLQVSPDVRNEWLADRPGLLEVILKTLGPSASSGGPQEHEGEEFILVLEGHFCIELAGTSHTLEAGDSLHFPSHVVHRWSNPGPDTAKVLWVSTEIGIWSSLSLPGRFRLRDRGSTDGAATEHVEVR